ncbi:MAG: DUF6049 family protein [Candidatus Nanopelagicales bacterium]
MTLGRTRTLARTLACGVACCLALILIPSPAGAEDTTGPVQTTITGLAPVALGAESSLSLTGAVANTGLDALGSVAVRLAVSSSPIASRRDLRIAATSDSAYTTQPIYTSASPVIDVLSPGAIVNYRLVVDADELPLNEPGVYVMAVDTIGYGPNGYAVLDTERILVPYMPDEVTPVNITWLWPLATTPSQAPDDVLLGEAIPRDLAPRGRLNDLLTAGESSRSITWVVDPQLLEVAADMSDGYLVDRAGKVRAGTRAQAAADWLVRARELLGPARPKDPEQRTRPMWAMPYADPDANALESASLTTDLVRATTSAPLLIESELRRAPGGTLAWAANSRPTQSALDVLASAGVRAVVVRDRAAPVVIDRGYTPSGIVDVEASGGRVRALVIDPGLLKALEMPQSGQASVLAARQRFMAELAYVALEPAVGARYLIAAAPSPRWDTSPRLLRALIASIQSTEWAKIVPVDDVLALPTPDTGRSYRPKPGGGRAFDSDYLARLESIRAGIESLRTVLTDPLPVTGPITSALLRAESSAWRSRPREGKRMLNSIDVSLAATASMVRVVPRENVVLSGDSGSVPVTVTNDLDQPVRVGLVLTAGNSARLAAEPVAAVEIAPGKRASLEVPVRIIGGDPLDVAVQLTDPAGGAFGEPVALELRTTAYSRAALWVAIAAASLLVLLVIFDIVRRSRGRRRSKATA